MSCLICSANCGCDLPLLLAIEPFSFGSTICKTSPHWCFGAAQVRPARELKYRADRSIGKECHPTKQPNKGRRKRLESPRHGNLVKHRWATCSETASRSWLPCALI